MQALGLVYCAVLQCCFALQAVHTLVSSQQPKDCDTMLVAGLHVEQGVHWCLGASDLLQLGPLLPALLSVQH